MFDFPAVLKEADNAAESNDFARATFYYWLIDFAFEKVINSFIRKDSKRR